MKPSQCEACRAVGPTVMCNLCPTGPRRSVQPPATPQEPEQAQTLNDVFVRKIERVEALIQSRVQPPALSPVEPTPEPETCDSPHSPHFAWLRSRRASTPSPEGQTTWQPIETAPKDGTPVLLWWRDEHDVEWWACGRWRQFGDGSRGWFGESFHSSEVKSWTRLLGECPTHWMPLPSPPTPGGTKP